MKELRNKASYDNRTVTIVSNGYQCSSSDHFDAEFTTQNIDDVIDYLYPN